MATVVVPFRDSDPKQRLRLPDDARRTLAAAMLADVVAAASAIGPVLVVAAERPSTSIAEDVTFVADPGGGQGAAVLAGLGAAGARGLPAPYLVVNADLPCATARDLLALAGAVPLDGLAIAQAADGTTNALGLADTTLFVPAYGPRSAERYAALGPARLLDAPNLVDDVDTLEDVRRVRDRVGSNTSRALDSLDLPRAA